MAGLEYECPKCSGETISFEQYEKNRFCQQCKTILKERRFPKHWIFQFNPSVYRWFDWIKEKKETEQWFTTRHTNEIFKGDKMIIWASGERAGIYALGEIIDVPQKRLFNPLQKKYWINKNILNSDSKSVMVKYIQMLLDKPILKDECVTDPILKDMKILKNSQGTNFKLDKKQWNRILEISRK